MRAGNDHFSDENRSADPDLTDLVAMTEDLIAALDAAGERLAATYADMARNVLTSRLR